VRATWIAALVATSACWKGTPTGEEPKPPPPPPGPTPEARARQIVEAQIDAASGTTNPNTTPKQREAAVRATFAPDAVVLEEGGARFASESDSFWFEEAAVATLAADGDADVVWFTVTFRDVAPEGHRNPNSTMFPPARYAGVAARSAGWKVVAASVAMAGYKEVSGSGQVGRDSFPNATTSAVLAPLVLDGPSLARALPSKAMVIGLGRPPPIAFGPQALGPWSTRRLMLDPDAREVVAPTWATLQARVVFSSAGEHGNLGIFAVARRERDAWQPVLVEYMGY
jgi:hypothetical protein